VEKWWETDFLSNEEKEQWIKGYVERETTGARKRGENAEAALLQEQEDMKHGEIAPLTNREPESTVDKTMIAFGESLSDLASSDDWDEGEDVDDEETGQGKLSEDDEPSWVMCTITKMVEQCMQMFQHKQMKLDELTRPRWEDEAEYFREGDKKCGTSELIVPAVVQPQTDDDASAPAPRTFGEHMEYLEIVPRISTMLQGTSQPRSSQMRLGSMKPQLNTSIYGLPPPAQHDTSPLMTGKPDESISFYPCIEPPATHHINFGCRRTHGDSYWVCGGIDRQTVIFDVISLWKALCLPILLRVSFFLISGTKLWDKILHLCMCKSRTHHVKVQELKSPRKTVKIFDSYLQMTIKRQSKS